MRIFYFLLKIFLQYTLRLFYPKIKLINPQKNFFGRTIYVSNHASSFMDPLVITVPQRPIVFFMTRSDVFKPITKPFMWSVHMLPIYREHDGVDTKKKNEAVFQTCTRILKNGRGLLIFGEGFTDDVFIRRLKPIKKGAARIGFGSLESLNWKKKIYMSAVGINYSDPNVMGSSILISNSERFCLNEYKELYQENPAIAINEVTKRIEKALQDQLTHVQDLNWVFFHEHVSRLKRNAMHASDYDPQLSLKTRWENSKNLAHWMNAQELNENPDLVKLKSDLETYFKLQKRLKIEEHFLHEKERDKTLKTSKELLILCLLAPLIPLGLIHFFVPYTLIKRFVEKSFKRKVFWSSVKMILGMFTMGAWNALLLIPLNVFLIHAWLPVLAYYLILPLLGKATYKWFKTLRTYKTKQKLNATDLSELLKKRSDLLSRINELVKV